MRHPRHRRCHGHPQVWRGTMRGRRGLRPGGLVRLGRLLPDLRWRAVTHARHCRPWRGRRQVVRQRRAFRALGADQGLQRREGGFGSPFRRRWQRGCEGQGRRGGVWIRWKRARGLCARGVAGLVRVQPHVRWGPAPSLAQDRELAEERRQRVQWRAQGAQSVQPPHVRGAPELRMGPMVGVGQVLPLRRGAHPHTDGEAQGERPGSRVRRRRRQGGGPVPRVPAAEDHLLRVGRVGCRPVLDQLRQQRLAQARAQIGWHRGAAAGGARGSRWQCHWRRRVLRRRPRGLREVRGPARVRFRHLRTAGLRVFIMVGVVAARGVRGPLPPWPRHRARGVVPREAVQWPAG
mmetsp:Transcript_36059/g.108975  ORF Transcript_36059/g.108975 Transcript_36059/m.108975 type:complete len:348 (+) Transcript_36059:1516-2559(+)